MKLISKLSLVAGLALSASAFAQPADNCADAPELASGTHSFDTTGATNDGTASCGVSAASADVWFKHTPALSGSLIVATCGGTSMDTVLAAFDGCGGTQLVCLDDFCGLQTQIAVPVSAGVPVWVRIAGFNGATGSGTFTITAPEPPPANDNCADAATLTIDTPVNFNTINATNDGTASCIASNGPDVWFKFTAPAAGFYRASTCGSALDTVVTVLDACGGSEIVCNDDACGLQSRADFNASSGQEVWIRVGGFQALVGTGSITVSAIPVPWIEDGDAGDLPDTAQVPSGTGNLAAITGTLDPSDADMFRIRVCDYANFSATTVGGAAFDTQLFLFNTDGMGVSFNDDSTGLQSRVTGQFLSADGDYLIALAGYNHDAVDSAGAIIWANTPFGTERQPDGPGAANPIAGWTGTGGGGPYTIEFTGTCYPGGTTRCVADVDDGTFSGTPDGGVTIDDLLYYLTIYADGNIAADVDNGTFSGTQDGGVTIDDLLYFLFRFNDGC